jgi:hypothetical protein
MSEYQIKLEAIEEYKDALRFKKLNEELCDSLLGLLGELTDHYKEAGLKVPEEVSRIMSRTAEAIDAGIAASKTAPPITQTKK